MIASILQNACRILVNLINPIRDPFRNARAGASASVCLIFQFVHEVC